MDERLAARSIRSLLVWLHACQDIGEQNKCSIQLRTSIGGIPCQFFAACRRKLDRLFFFECHLLAVNFHVPSSTNSEITRCNTVFFDEAEMRSALQKRTRQLKSMAVVKLLASGAEEAALC